uniref:Uncharacterized protein n=1 Tax=Jahnella sp. MSr9139 TaxID=1434086 RepID=A0A4Y5SZJ9_9BACT|nr:hypothetical protein [Jahnella sp. MSr9139]
MADQQDNLEARLDRLRAATEGLRPRAGLGARVMARIEGRVAPRDPGLAEVISLSARRALALSAVAAAASVALGLQMESSLAGAEAVEAFEVSFEEEGLLP